MRTVAGADPAAGTLLVLLSAYHEELLFVLPEAGAESTEWEVLLDTRCAEPPDGDRGPMTLRRGRRVSAGGAHARLLRRVPPDEVPDWTPQRRRRRSNAPRGRGRPVGRAVHGDERARQAQQAAWLNRIGAIRPGRGWLRSSAVGWGHPGARRRPDTGVGGNQ